MRSGGTLRAAVLAGVALRAVAAAGAEELPTVLPNVNISAEVPLRKVAEYHMAAPRFAPAAATYEGEIYIIGGQTTDGTVLDSIEQFNPRTGRTRQVLRLETARMYHRAVVAGDRLYVIGGAMRVALATRNTVALVDPGTGAIMGPLRSPAAYAWLGEDDSSDSTARTRMQLLSSIEVINLKTGLSEPQIEMPDARRDFGCIPIGQEIYVIGGMHFHGRRIARTNTVRILDVATRQWKDGPPMRTPREGAAVLVDGPFVIVAGGYNGMRALTEVEVYNPRTRHWSDLPRLCEAVSAQSMIAARESLFLFGNYGSPERIVAYDLVKRTSEWFTLQFTPARHTSAVFLDGRLYVIGGKEATFAPPLDLIQVFEPTKKPARGHGSH